MPSPLHNLLSKINPRAGKPMLPSQSGGPPRLPGKARSKGINNAALIYGLGAGMLYVLSFYNLASAEWFNGLMLLIPSTALAFLAYKYTQ
ncbi:MAG: hypothetical protein AB7G06_01895 [Bdellovibrionales bacterium]